MSKFGSAWWMRRLADAAETLNPPLFRLAIALALTYLVAYSAIAMQDAMLDTIEVKGPDHATAVVWFWSQGLLSEGTTGLVHLEDDE